MTIRSHVARSLLFSAATLAIAAPAWAQAADEKAAPSASEGREIIVTATKRASTIQDVPFSINAQTQEDIQKANASTIEDISRNVAGLAVQNLGPGQSQVSVRGVSAGQIVRDQPGVKEQVGIYLDESVISLSLFTPDLDLFDLNRVETLRGPQGTLFGSGSVGGTVRYISNQPKLNTTEGTFEGNINFAKGGDLGYASRGAVNVPIGDTFAVRLVGYYQKFPGFVDAIGPAAGKNVNDGDRLGTRISALWQPIPELKITPRYIWQRVGANGFNRQEVFNLYSNQYTVPQHIYDEREQYLKLREQFRDKTRLADLTIAYDFGGVELTSVSSRIKRNILVSRDASALTGSVSVDLGFPTAAVNLPSNLRDTTHMRQFTQELRLGSTGSGPLQWVFGGFYSKVKRDYTQLLPTPGYDAYTDASFGAGTSAALANGFPLNSPYNSYLPYIIKQKSLFGEASYDFGQIKLTAGARAYKFNEVRDFISGGLFSNVDNLLNEKTSSSGISPRVIATYEPNRNLSFNVQAAKGFRLGGVNDPINLGLCSASDRTTFSPFQGSYKDEKLWNYEAGMKYGRGPITFNAAVFHTKIDDLQVTVDAGSCSSRLVINAQGHTTGMEAEFSVRPARGFDLSFAGSYVSAKFDNSLPGSLATTTGIREGNRLPSVPKFQMAATATYTTRVSSNADVYVTGSFQHVGSRYTQPSDQENNPRTFVSGLPFNGATGTGATVLDLKLPSYNLVNLSAGLDFDSGLSLIAYVNNLFDENALLSFDRERGGRARLGYNIGQPRTMGMTIRMKFSEKNAAPLPPPVIAPVAPPAPPATQTCADGSVILATDACPAPPPPPAPPAPEPEPVRG